MADYWVYILSSGKNGTLYIGVTNNIARRAYEHKEKLTEGFTKKYGTNKLVYAEPSHSIEDAIMREKALKKWRREWKIRLIEEHNPEWKDLYEHVV